MISHRNVISNVLQIRTQDDVWRRHMTKSGEPVYRDVVLGLLPQSHIYALVAVDHISVYSGDKCVILPKFDMKSYLNAIQTQKIVTLYLVGLSREPVTGFRG